MNSLVSLPIVAAVPTAAPAISTASDDALIAAINEHKVALDRMAAATDDARRLRRLAESKIGAWATLPAEKQRAFCDYLDSISPYGDHDTIIDNASDQLAAATQELSEIVPTSLSGLLLYASYAQQVIEHEEATFDEQDLQSMLLSLAQAADRLRDQTPV